MPSIDLRQLRDTRKLKRWLRAGQTVEVRERNEVIGDLIPRPPSAAPTRLPDFAARLKEDFGDRLIPAVDTLLESRENSRY
ncbi:hypothetical protein [Occallatibacter riparius]|uniref:Uncharacterized protein n=1 Tax=Occallatibacter riparius TaxID=1002689 RepID=A0A9J7BVQ9_9BACT|nr:hypothetical protein [Occallatibacter riparius]UWZ86617.1 hypothetical protein MOP44_11885 [Occallatibacter riparius]